MAGSSGEFLSPVRASVTRFGICTRGRLDRIDERSIQKMSRSKEERMPQAGQSPDQTREPAEPPVSGEPLHGHGYYSRESYREYPRRSTSRRALEERDVREPHYR